MAAVDVDATLDLDEGFLDSRWAKSALYRRIESNRNSYSNLAEFPRHAYPRDSEARNSLYGVAPEIKNMRWSQAHRCLMKFEPPFDRSKPDTAKVVPFGWSPDGDWITSAIDLPYLPIPKHVQVTGEFLVIDGWLFPTSDVSKGFLKWFKNSLLRWKKEDECPRSDEWIHGIANAFCDRATGKS